MPTIFLYSLKEVPDSIHREIVYYVDIHNLNHTIKVFFACRLPGIMTWKWKIFACRVPSLLKGLSYSAAESMNILTHKYSSLIKVRVHICAWRHSLPQDFKCLNKYNIWIQKAIMCIVFWNHMLKKYHDYCLAKLY